MHHTLARIASKLKSCLTVLALVLGTMPANAATTVLNAIEDFPNRSAGDAPFYAETARGALAINAADPTLRNVFAKAETTFSGISGVYDITLIGLAELDGEALYRFSVNDELIGSAQNAETSVDFMPMAHQFSDVSLTTGDVLAVESLANSNDLIPEGDGYAFARGRWTELRLTPDGEIDVQAEKVSLISNASSLNTQLNIGDIAVVDYAVINDDTAGATATNLRVQFNVSENLEPIEPNNCTTIIAIHPGSHVLRCSLSQLAPGGVISGQLSLRAVSTGTKLSVHATAIANETERSGIDNRATILFSISDTDSETDTGTDTGTGIELSVVSNSEDTTQQSEDSESLSSFITESQNVGEGGEASNIDFFEVEEIIENTNDEFTDNVASEVTSSADNTFQSLPESEAVQSVTPAQTESGNSIMTGAIGMSAGAALLFFILLAVRRIS